VEPSKISKRSNRFDQISSTVPKSAQYFPGDPRRVELGVQR
jgi:hypothetical protein